MYSDKNFSALSPSSISGLQCSIVSDESCISGDSFRSKDHVQDFFRTCKALNLEGSIEGLICRSIEPPLAFDGRFGRMFWGFDRRLPSVKKGPQSNESYERENPWNRTISTVLWVHRKLPQSTVKPVLPSNESYESKTGCTRTLATVLWVPLRVSPISRPFFSMSRCLARQRPFFGQVSYFGPKARNAVLTLDQPPQPE